MQRELIAEVERARPDYVVYVNDTLSWLPRASSDCGVFDWWKSYWSTNLDLMTIINVKQVGDDGVGPDPRSPGPPGANCLILLKRKAATSNQ
jgi:hypothetical protein